MNSADPSVTVAAAVALEKSTMESIRSIQHRDMNGDIIGLNHDVSRAFTILMPKQSILIDRIPPDIDLNDPSIRYEHSKPQSMEQMPGEHSPERVRE